MCTATNRKMTKHSIRLAAALQSFDEFGARLRWWWITLEYWWGFVVAIRCEKSATLAQYCYFVANEWNRLTTVWPLDLHACVTAILEMKDVGRNVTMVTWWMVVVIFVQNSVMKFILLKLLCDDWVRSYITSVRPDNSQQSSVGLMNIDAQVIWKFRWCNLSHQ